MYKLLFTAVLPKRLYKTHTPCIRHHLRDKRQRSYHGFIKHARQTPSLLTLSPFLLFLHWRSSLTFCLLFLFPSPSISWTMLAVSISFCNRDFIGWHVFDIQSGQIYLQDQYSLYFYPFVCSVFLVQYSFLWLYLFSMLSLLLFLQQLPGFQPYKGV